MNKNPAGNNPSTTKNELGKTVNSSKMSNNNNNENSISSGGLASPPLNRDNMEAGKASAGTSIYQNKSINQQPLPGHTWPIYEQSFKHFSFDETLSVTFYGRRLSVLKQVFFYTASVCTFGFLFLMSRWSSRFLCWATTVACPLAVATHVLVINSFEQHELVPVSVVRQRESIMGLFKEIREQDEATGVPFEEPEEEVTSQASLYYPGNPVPVRDDQLRIIDYRCNRFILSVLSGKLVSVGDFRLIPLPSLEAVLSGVRPEGMVQRQRLVFGANVIEVLGKTVWDLLFQEVLHPFNVFQVACITLWCTQGYLTYVYVLSGLTILSCATTLYEARVNTVRMREMARYVCPVTVWRDGKWCEDVGSEELVPGDLLRLDVASCATGADGQVVTSRLEILPCDGVILNGDALVDESMLTGETIPVAKTAIDKDNAEDFERVCWGDMPTGATAVPATGAPAKTNPPMTKSIVYAGTRLIRARHSDGRPPIVMVHRTGFLTAKGNLVQSILFPRPNNFRFYQDMIVFITLLASIAFCGFIFALYCMLKMESAWSYIVKRALDLFTIVVPPAIHTVMSIGTIFAMRRLKDRHRIYCISPPRINVASRIDLICFDKTGTLTEEGLDVKLVLQADSLADGTPQFAPHSASVGDMRETEAFPSLIEVMASCHSVQVVNDELIGDPLDLKMFDFTAWQLEEAVETSEGLAPTVVRPPPSAALSPFSKTDDLGIVRCFEFVSQLRRMSVVVQPLDKPDQISILCKGSPESLRDICLPETVPASFNRVLAEYAQQGYRVLACAGRRLVTAADPVPPTWSQVQKLSRKQIERDLEFMGFIIFENKLKPETKPAIDVLKGAAISTVMSTGDNILTAVCVGRACGLVGGQTRYVFLPKLLDPSSHLPTSIAWECLDDESLKMDPVTWEVEGVADPSVYTIACTGEVMEHIFMACGDAYSHALLQRCSIFARMSPAQKQILVEFYQKFGHSVGFCGDGANDCGALRAADVGISLSQAEASVAAPFTSKIADIRCCLAVIREGRASLVTSFCLLKFMGLYSMIQFSSLIFLYTFASSLGDYQFTYADIMLVLPLGLLLTRFDTSDKITKKPPSSKLLSFPVMLSLIGQSLLQFAAQVTAYVLTIRLPDYSPPVTAPDEPNFLCLENTSIFLTSTFLYITTAVMFSQGGPYRRRWYWPFFIWCVIAALCNFALFFWDNTWLASLMDFVPISLEHKTNLLLIAGVHAAASAFAEFVIFPTIVGVFNSLPGSTRIHTMPPIHKGADRA